jgi:molybdate transport system substrate-binding protein
MTLPTPHQSVVSLWSALVIRRALDSALIPAFEAQGGWRVDVVFDPTTVLMARIAQGELPEVLVATADSIRGLPNGTLVEGTAIPLVRSGIGLGVAEGSSVGGITGVPELKAALLRARSVAYSRTGQSGIHFASLIEKLGIADQVNKRATIIDKGFTGEAIVDGRADLAIQQISELRFVDGIAVVGPLPDPVQTYTDFSVAITRSGTRSGGAHALLKYLTGDAANGAYLADGLELPPATSRRISSPDR